MTLAWIAVALVFAIVEVATLALFAAFVSLGAIGAAAIAFAGGDLVAQAVLFGVVSVGGIIVLRRPLMRHLQRRHTPETLSGAAAMIGQTALVVDAIRGRHERGHVRVGGEDWPAFSRDGFPVDAGATVRVVDIQGATLVVDRASGPL